MNGNLAYKLEQQEEVINGKVVMMATPTSNHNRITVNLSNIFGAFLRGKPCEYFSDREALYLEEDMEESADERSEESEEYPEESGDEA